MAWPIALQIGLKDVVLTVFFVGCFHVYQRDLWLILL